MAPIALYPDPLLAQVLAAFTYPLEIVQLNQWLGKHKDLKDKALADALEKEGWDPSVQALAALPDIVKQLTENIQWTSELGNRPSRWLQRPAGCSGRPDGPLC